MRWRSEKPGLSSRTKQPSTKFQTESKGSDIINANEAQKSRSKVSSKVRPEINMDSASFTHYFDWNSDLDLASFDRLFKDTFLCLGG